MQQACRPEVRACVMDMREQVGAAKWETLTARAAVLEAAVMAAQAAAVESMMWGMEAKSSQWGKYIVPDRHAVYAAQTLT